MKCFYVSLWRPTIRGDGAELGSHAKVHVDGGCPDAYINEGRRNQSEPRWKAVKAGCVEDIDAMFHSYRPIFWCKRQSCFGPWPSNPRADCREYLIEIGAIKQ